MLLSPASGQHMTNYFTIPVQLYCCLPILASRYMTNYITILVQLYGCLPLCIPVQLNCYLLSNPAACPCHQYNLSCHVPIVPKTWGWQRLYLLYFGLVSKPLHSTDTIPNIRNKYSQKRIVRPQSKFPRSCVCKLFLYSHDRSAYSAAGNTVCGLWTDPGNFKNTHRHKNVEIVTEVPQFPEKEYINGIFVAV